MKNRKGITLISLVITIVILIILAGVAINLTLGENGIFTKAKEAKRIQKIAEIKEQIGIEILAAQVEAVERNEGLEQAQIADIISNYGELQADGDTIILKDSNEEVSLLDIYNGTTVTNGSYSENKAKIELLETQVARLEQQLDDASKSQTEASKELNELKATLSQVTATEAQILKDYTAYKDGNLITGTIENRGELNWSPTSSETYTVPIGYYSGGTLDSSNVYNAGYNDGVSSSGLPDTLTYSCGGTRFTATYPVYSKYKTIKIVTSGGNSTKHYVYLGNNSGTVASYTGTSSSAINKSVSLTSTNVTYVQCSFYTSDKDSACYFSVTLSV